MTRHKKHRIKLKSFYVWHRYVGLTIAILVMVLALTGVALNHTEPLRLDSRYVSNSWLLDWYGIEAPAPAASYATAAGPVTQVGERLYLGTQQLHEGVKTFKGALALERMLVIAADDELLLFTRGGELLAQLTALDGTPNRIERLGAAAPGRLIVANHVGQFEPDADFVRWIPWNGDRRAVVWPQPAALPQETAATLRERYRATILPWERVLLDLHSGRILGNGGPWLMDAAAGLMLFLAGTGIYMWAKRRR